MSKRDKNNIGISKKIDKKIDDLYELRCKDNVNIEKHILWFSGGTIIVFSSLLNNDSLINQDIKTETFRCILISSLIPIICVIFSYIIGYIYTNRLIKKSEKLRHNNDYNKTDVNAIIYMYQTKREAVISKVNMFCVFMFVICISFMTYKIIKLIF